MRLANSLSNPSSPKRLEKALSTDKLAIRAYTRHLLPFKYLFAWLNRGDPNLPPTKNFTNREFAFTLQNDAYFRYNSFKDWEDFKKESCRLDPLRFEIGPVYSAKVSQVKQAAAGRGEQGWWIGMSRETQRGLQKQDWSCLL